MWEVLAGVAHDLLRLRSTGCVCGRVLTMVERVDALVTAPAQGEPPTKQSRLSVEATASSTYHQTWSREVPPTLTPSQQVYPEERCHCTTSTHLVRGHRFAEVLEMDVYHRVHPRSCHQQAGVVDDLVGRMVTRLTKQRCSQTDVCVSVRRRLLSLPWLPDWCLRTVFEDIVEGCSPDVVISPLICNHDDMVFARLVRLLVVRRSWRMAPYEVYMSHVLKYCCPSRPDWLGDLLQHILQDYTPPRSFMIFFCAQYLRIAENVNSKHLCLTCMGLSAEWWRVWEEIVAPQVRTWQAQQPSRKGETLGNIFFQVLCWYGVEWTKEIGHWIAKEIHRNEDVITLEDFRVLLAWRYRRCVPLDDAGEALMFAGVHRWGPLAAVAPRCEWPELGLDEDEEEEEEEEEEDEDGEEGEQPRSPRYVVPRRRPPDKGPLSPTDCGGNCFDWAFVLLRGLEHHEDEWFRLKWRWLTDAAEEFRTAEDYSALLAVGLFLEWGEEYNFQVALHALRAVRTLEATPDLPGHVTHWTHVLGSHLRSLRAVVEFDEFLLPGFPLIYVPDMKAALALVLHTLGYPRDTRPPPWAPMSPDDPLRKFCVVVIRTSDALVGNRLLTPEVRVATRRRLDAWLPVLDPPPPQPKPAT